MQMENVIARREAEGIERFGFGDGAHGTADDMETLPKPAREIRFGRGLDQGRAHLSFLDGVPVCVENGQFCAYASVGVPN
ncbi:MAG: hypothetical protein KIT22_20155, partial [Verrucomicrobiae bacterium]|nr:hypothetical protein [Verrucomicrobiae bacterium]